MEQNENTLSVLKIAPGQYPQQVEIDNNLKALQEAVGGTIAAVYPFADPVAIICNDDGKLMGLPLNLSLIHISEGMSKRTQLEEYFSQSLEIDLLLRLYPDDEDTIYQIVDLLVDTCATNRKLLRIAGDDKPAEVVRSRFMKLNADHIRFVLKLSLIHI